MGMFAHRSITQTLRALFEGRHYKALANMAVLSGSFGAVLIRYLTGKGRYPFVCEVKTPLGRIAPTLYSYHDLLTLNEIFFREDYAADGNERVIVDIGSNIGLSALYFLTRNKNATCYLFEPDPRNVERLRGNLSAFTERYILKAAAVADRSGRLEFGLDVISGRYGGLGVETGHSMPVDCVHINEALIDALAQHGRVDLLKIDTEGSELKTIQAIDARLLPKIGKIYCEALPGAPLHSDVFKQTGKGTVTRLVNRRL